MTTSELLARRIVRVLIGGVEHCWSLDEAYDVRERVSLAIADAKAEMASEQPCSIAEYDGAYRCVMHRRQWGAITNPDEPCAGWIKT